MSHEPESERGGFRPAERDLDAAFRFFGRVTSDLITIFGVGGHIHYTNPAAERILGLPPGECVGKDLFAFVHEEERAGARAAFERWREADGDRLLLIETRILTRMGDLRHVHWSVAPYRQGHGAVRCFIAHARDVTAQVGAAMRLRRSELRGRALLAGVLDPLVTIDGHGIVREASRSVEALFGYAPEELIGTNIDRLMTEPHRSRHDEYLARYLRTGATGILGRTRQFEVVRKDGQTLEIELSVSRVDVPGEPEPLFIGSFRDVTSRKRAELALAEREARMRAIFDQEFQFVGLLAPDGTLLEVNGSALRAIGATREDVIGRPFWETRWWSGDEPRRERVRAAVAAAAAGETVRFEVDYLDRQGYERWVDFSLKPVRDADGAVQFLLPEGHDVSLMKATHARELALNEALAEIGESASLLAHEIKNPLTAVNLALRAVADRLGEDQKSVLEDLASRLAKLERTMRRTLAFARPLELEMEVLAAGELLTDVAALVEPELRATSVRLDVDCPKELPSVRGDRGRLEEVLLNLVRNALEALPSGGRVRLSARCAGAELELCVEDDGEGIVPSLRADLFKPFVTSKAGGTGLGLAIARKIVREHGGEIDTAAGSLPGACFRIRLPVHASGRDAPRERASARA